MDNVEMVIKQELQDHPGGDSYSFRNEVFSDREPVLRENTSPAHSVTSNSSSSNNGPFLCNDKLLLPSAILMASETPNTVRKRKTPIKNSGSFSSKDSETDEDLEHGNYASRLLKDLASKRQDQPDAGVKVEQDTPTGSEEEAKSNLDHNHPLLESRLSLLEKRPTREFSVMSEERLRKQQINSRPRSHCPICGDRANGLHYGVYSCEGCKNFFKRSVMIFQDRPYVCKYDNACSVSVTAIDGVKQKGPRCQACRYQACLDAGMYHSGTQRSRGGRHTYFTSQQLATDAAEKFPLNGSVPRLEVGSEAPSASKFPRMQLPDIGARLHAAHYQHLFHNLSSDQMNGNNVKQIANTKSSDGDEVTVTITPSQQKGENRTNRSLSHDDEDPEDDEDPLDCDYLSRFRTENLIAQVKLLKSQNRELTAISAEKDKQMWLYRRQLSIMKRALVIAKCRNVQMESPAHTNRVPTQNPTLKALLSDATFSRNVSLTETTTNVFDNFREKSSGGSLTLTPVNVAKVGGTTASEQTNGNVYTQDASFVQDAGHEMNEDFHCEPLEPDVILETEFSGPVLFNFTTTVFSMYKIVNRCSFM